jgi:hypothetical protein
MIDISIQVVCDGWQDGDYCEAYFEVQRTGLNWRPLTLVARQLEKRGWVRREGKVYCPLHKGT